MQFSPPLQQGLFLRRYKRFLADIISAEGEPLTIHCANTGSMKNCLVPDSACWYSSSANIMRKYPHTWEIATTPSGHLAGINTARANHLVAEAVALGIITELQGYSELRAEVAYGSENSRADFMLADPARASCVVEVKNVTLLEENTGFFPDAVSTRGSKHLRELIQVVAAGQRAVLLFCVQHQGICSVAPAVHVDPVYAGLCQQALEAGVEFYAYRARLCAQEISLAEAIPVVI